MNILSIETSMGCASAALSKRDGPSIVKTLKPEQTAAETLIPLIADVMREGDTLFSALSLVAVSVGPGGFSGIRTGVAAARGIGLAARIPVVGATSFRIMAYQVRNAAVSGGLANVTLVAAAGVNAFYCQHLRDGEPDTDILYLEAPQALTFVGRYDAGIAGPGAKALSVMDGQASVISDIHPTAEALAAIASSLDARIDRPVPFYIRPADAKPQTGHVIPRQRNAAA